ncbi:MAG: T9SS type A sorting domain-containing protein [Bacteroidetes bacterium]|nr:T9SS type A sorting domain-containing protein [Bacteroidota bacterium]
MIKGAFFFLLLPLLSCFAQTPVFNWGSSAGGSDDDIIYDIAIPDSLIFQCTIGCPLTLVGTTKSDDGNLTNCNSLIAGNNQALVLKFTTFGTLSDCFSYGGSGNDQFNKAKYQKTGNGFHKVYLGRTSSNDGDVSGNHGIGDAWLVRTKDDTIINQVCIGGQGDESGLDFIEMPDHGFIICGYTNSIIISGMPMTQHGQYDAWIARVDSLGSVIWTRRYGGNLGDRFTSITRTTDGNFVCVGYSNSTDSAFSVNHGANDYWIIKIDTSGNLLWQKIYGGSGSDITYKVSGINNNILVSGYSSSFNGDVIGNHSLPGNEDVWILKLDSSGNIIWKKCFGGAGFEINYTFLNIKGNNTIVTASGNSLDGDLTGITGYRGTWVFKIDSMGNIIWSKQFGSNNAEGSQTSIVTYDSRTFYFISHPGSVGGNVTVFYGGFNDIWIASVTDTSSSVGISEQSFENELIDISPNPTSGIVNITKKFSSESNAELYNYQGGLLKRFDSPKSKEFFFDMSSYNSGIYFLKIKSNNKVVTKKIIKTE